MLKDSHRVRVLFVCTGNICRSPTAEGVFRALTVQENLEDVIGIDSAGTGGWHVGEPPDRRAQAAAKARGIDLAPLRARKVQLADFSTFDLILAMDRGHFRALARMAPPQVCDRVQLFLRHAPDLEVTDVPDPYYGGTQGFEHVLDLIERGCTGLLGHIRRTYLDG